MDPTHHRLGAGRLAASTALIIVTAFAASCNPSPPTTAQQLDQATEQATEQTAQAAQDLKDFTIEQKEEYTTMMQARMAELKRTLDKLEARIKASSAAAQAEAKPKLDLLRQQWVKLGQQFDRVKDAGVSTWDEVTAAVRTGYDSMLDGINAARTWTSEQIAP